MNQYDQGDVVRCTAVFTDIAAAPIDPTAVFAQIKAPSGTVTVYQYGVDAAVVKTATGNYRVDVNADQGGLWYCRFYSTGSGQGSSQLTFFIEPSAI